MRTAPLFAIAAFAAAISAAGAEENAVIALGQANETPKICGGIAGFQCPQGQWCDYPEGAFCGFADASGECKTIPEVCVQIYSPVCGCDGKTYASACEANAAGVDAREPGECETSQ